MRTVSVVACLLTLPLAGCSSPSATQPAKTWGTLAEPGEGDDGGDIVLGAPIRKGKTATDWIETLEHGDAVERRKAVGALRGFAAHADDPQQPFAGKAGDAAVAALARALKDPDKEVRLTAAHVLGEVGPKAKAARPALVEASKADEDASVREAAAGALQKLDRGAAPKAGQDWPFPAVND